SAAGAGAVAVAGSDDGGPDGAEMRPRRGRTNSSQPPVPSASTAMTMIRITYSIRLTVSQTPPAIATIGAEGTRTPIGAPAFGGCGAQPSFYGGGGTRAPYGGRFRSGVGAHKPRSMGAGAHK